MKSKFKIRENEYDNLFLINRDNIIIIPPKIKAIIPIINIIIYNGSVNAEEFIFFINYLKNIIFREINVDYIIVLLTWRIN